MKSVLADTHSIVWYLSDPKRLSSTADAALIAAVHAGMIFISAITLVEINYLIGRRSFPYNGVLAQLYSLVTDPNQPITVLPVTIEVAQALDYVPRVEIPDMPDRIIAATAVAHNLPLISVDSNIQGSMSLKAKIQVIW